MNIANILKDCPSGIILYSPVIGGLKLEYVKSANETAYPISAQSILTGGNYVFTEKGKLYKFEEGECVLFPSKEQRDWKKFKVPRMPLEKGTPCICFDEDDLLMVSDLRIRYYYGNNSCYVNCKDDDEIMEWKHIIPINKFDFNELRYLECHDYGTAYKE